MGVSKLNLWHRIKILFVFLAPSLLLGAVVGLYPGYRFYRYAWFNPQFCTSCHVHDYATVSWSQSIHGEKTTCHDCHHQRLRDYVKEAYVMATHPPTFPKDLHHTPYVAKSLCSACHVANFADHSTITGPMASEDIEKIPKVDLSKLHKAHLSKETEFSLLNTHSFDENERDVNHLHPTLEINRTKAEKRLITCADCHGGPANRGHNFSAVDSTCIRCHEAPHKTKVGQTYGCRSCHFQEFLIPLTPKAQ